MKFIFKVAAAQFVIAGALALSRFALERAVALYVEEKFGGDADAAGAALRKLIEDAVTEDAAGK